LGNEDRTYFLHASLEPTRVAWRYGTFSRPSGLQTWHLWYDAPFHEQATVTNIAGLFYAGVVDLAELTTDR